jgi:ppGpp synthetase/RelA/SpoT-type nucleotidyltranferase
MQDLAGLRLVGEMTLNEQDELIAQVLEAFPGSKLDDLRTDPSYGYRGVHVILKIDDYPVELQIRTTLQHLWADYFEKLADQFGRQIRYGQRPIDPEKPAALGTRRETVDELMNWSRLIAEVET